MAALRLFVALRGGLQSSAVARKRLPFVLIPNDYSHNGISTVDVTKTLTLIENWPTGVNECNGDFSPVESPSPMNGIYFVGVLLNRKP